jgi:hypothetical protein
MALLRKARLPNRERYAGPMWRPSEGWLSGWDGEFESPLLQRRVTCEPEILSLAAWTMVGVVLDSCEHVIDAAAMLESM